MPLMQSGMMDEEFTARAVAPVLPRAGCDTAQVLDYISQQLDCFGREPLLLGRYQLLGPRHRCTGGTSQALGYTGAVFLGKCDYSSTSSYCRSLVTCLVSCYFFDQAVTIRQRAV